MSTLHIVGDGATVAKQVGRPAVFAWCCAFKLHDLFVPPTTTLVSSVEKH